MARLHERSVVAIDPTTRGVAFVFFENGEPLDWGERLSSRDLQSALIVVDRVLNAYRASVLVIEDTKAWGCRRRPRVRELLAKVAARARRRDIAVISVPRLAIRKAWEARGAPNKETIATAIGDRFPQLAAIVPPPRRIGRHEDSRVNVFDAASLALHVFDRARIAR